MSANNVAIVAPLIALNARTSLSCETRTEAPLGANSETTSDSLKARALR